MDSLRNKLLAWRICGKASLSCHATLACSIGLTLCVGLIQAQVAKPNTSVEHSGASEGVPQLVDITASTGIHFEHLSSPEQKFIVESMSGGVALFDYDGDGWLDIYFTNAPSVAMTLAGKKAKGALYHNNHDGTFTDVTEKAGVGYRVGRWAPRLRMSITTAVPICWSVASAGSCFITTTATARSPTSPRSRDCRKTRDGLRAQPLATTTAMAILTFSFRIMSTSNWMIFRSSVQRKPVSITTSPFSAVRVVCKVLRMRCTT